MGSKKTVGIYITHLDHVSELSRLQQWKILQEQFINREEDHIVMGDFNALNRKDYTDPYWETITDIRKTNCWESPQSQLTTTIQDTYHYEDFYSKINLQKTTPLCDKQVGTCKFDTRIDYFLISQTLTNSLEWAHCYCEILQDVDGSDHYPIGGLITLNESICS